MYAHSPHTHFPIPANRCTQCRKALKDGVGYQDPKPLDHDQNMRLCEPCLQGRIRVVFMIPSPVRPADWWTA